MPDILDDITRTSIQLILKEPFYGHFFSGLVKEISDEVSTMGVILGGEELVKLSVNEHFYTTFLTTEDYKYGLLKHEILHIVFKHILTIGNFEHKKIANIAADIVVNQYIDKSQLPGDPVLLENFAELNLKPDQDIAYYYWKLLGLYRKNVSTEDATNIPFKSLLNKMAALDHPDKTDAVGDHKQWKSIPEAEKKVVDGMLSQLIRNTVDRVKKSPQFHDLPDGLKSYLNSVKEIPKPVVNWRRVLRLFATSSSRTYLKNTIQQPSKRYGTVPGIKVKRKNKLLVAIDTSGSLSGDNLSRFFAEMYHIFRQGASILVVECDMHIRKEYVYRGAMPEFASGRGSTSFEAPIVFANEKYKPDAIIYFTDGYAASPTTVSRAPLLWVISPGGIREDSHSWLQLPGRKVKMNL